jgi:hypothetical protein
MRARTQNRNTLGVEGGKGQKGGLNLHTDKLEIIEYQNTVGLLNYCDSY